LRRSNILAVLICQPGLQTQDWRVTPTKHLGLEFTFGPFGLEQIPNFRVVGSALGYHGEISVIGKEYFVRQAVILFGLAKATTDPKISAALLDKAADLKLQVDEPGAPPHPMPLAPDIEPPAT
jgi:hypothetical protein